MKNPDDMRLVIAAATLWILRFAQNDSFHFDYSICKFALILDLVHLGEWLGSRSLWRGGLLLSASAGRRRIALCGVRAIDEEGCVFSVIVLNARAFQR